MDPTRTEAGLREVPALAQPADEILQRNPDILQQHLGVLVGLRSAEVRVVVVKRRYVPDDGQPRRATRDEEYRLTFPRRGVRIGDAHDQKKRGDGGVGRKPLVPVDEPAVAVCPRSRANPRRIRACVGLGHGEAAADLTVEQRLQVPVPLLGRCADGEQFRVPRIRGACTEDRRRPQRLAEYLAEQRHLHLAPAGAAEMWREEGCP
jgi:hypothetical protein